MKKFEFSLQKLEDYKEQVLKKEKNTLASLRSQVAELVHKKEQTEILREKTNDEYNKMMSEGMTPAQIAFYKTYIEELSEKIISLNFKIETFKKNVARQLLVVTEVTKEIDSIEKLKEKKIEEYKKQDAKEQELFIEEFVSRKTFFEK